MRSCDASMAGPLRGCVLYVDKISLRAPANELGATVLDNLFDSSLTHIVSSRAMYSSAPDVTYVRPSWLEKCNTLRRRIAEDGHLLGALEGLEIVPSGLAIAMKKKLQRVCDNAGGVYSKGLARTCTHLVMLKPSGQKYDYVIEKGRFCKIVTPQWVFDSSEAGRCLDELNYVPSDVLEDKKTSPAPEPRPVPSPPAKDVSVASTVDPTRDSTSTLPPIVPPLSGSPGARRSSLSGSHSRRPRSTTATLHLDSLVLFMSSSPPWNKAVHQPNSQRVYRLAASGGATVVPSITQAVNTIVIVSVPVIAKEVRLIKEAESRGVRVVGIEWLEECIEQKKIVAPHAPNWDTSASSPPSQAAAFSFADETTPTAPATSRIFHGARVALGPVALRDSGAVSTLAATIQGGWGKVLPHNEEGFVAAGVPTHVVCPKSLNQAEQAVVNAIKTQNNKVIQVTQQWVNACIAEKCLLSAKVCVLFRPVCRVDCPELQGLHIAITGFNEHTSDWNRKRATLVETVRLLGGIYTERMGRRRTAVLIADDTIEDSLKVQAAREWEVPVVSHSWLLACAATGTKVPFSQHPLEATRNRNRDKDRGRPERKVKPGRRPPPLPTQQQHNHATQQNGTQTPMPDVKTISLFSKFATSLREGGDTLENESAGAGSDGTTPPAGAEERSVSVSLDTRDWSGSGIEVGSATQCQVIVHRDLTPPPSPVAGRRGRRSMPPRAAKAKRAKIGSHRPTA